MPLRVAFYGTGSGAQPYLRTLHRAPDAQLTAVCDLDRIAAAAAAAPWGARVFLSYEAMLEEARPDALWICVEPQLQGDVILKAAELGIPFYVLPPGSMDFQRATTYAHAIQAAGLLTAIGYTARLSDVFIEARAYLGSKQVPLALAWMLTSPRIPSSHDASRLLWNEGAYLVDAMRFFCGDVTRLSARFTRPMGGVNAQLEFQGGTIGTLACALFARPQPRIELELLGEGWSLLFASGLTTLQHAEHDKTTILHALNDVAWEATTTFLEAVADGTAACALPTYGDALKTLAMCHAIDDSANSQRVVEINYAAG